MILQEAQAFLQLVITAVWNGWLTWEKFQAERDLKEEIGKVNDDLFQLREAQQKNWLEASKEYVVHRDLRELKTDLDARFDRIERILMDGKK